MDYSEFDEIPHNYNRENHPFIDQGPGIPRLNKNNMTMQDMYKTSFLLLQDHHKNYNKMANDALKGIQVSSDLAKEFFSPKNMQRIQKKIREEVFKRTKGKFKMDVDQKEDDVFIHMRAVYLEYGRNLPGKMVRQTKRLNNIVIYNIVPDMITSIEQYYGYLKDINGPMPTMDRPVNVNGAGRRALPSLTTTFEGLYNV